MTQRKILALDFDGVVYAYSGDWDRYDEEPVLGAVLGIKRLHDAGYEIIVFSCRARSLTGVTAIWTWLGEHGLSQYVLNVTDRKPIAMAYIDDHGFTFQSWNDVEAGFL